MSWNMGIEVMTKKQVETARKNGITKNTVYNRTQALGWTIERAITTPLHVNRSEYFTKEDVDRAKENGISYKTFTTRVLTLGWTAKRASETPIIPNGKRTRYGE